MSRSRNILSQNFNKTFSFYKIDNLKTLFKSYYSGPPSDHFDGKKFFNPGKPYPISLGNFLQWRLTANRRPWPKMVQNGNCRAPEPRIYGGQLVATPVGHATILLQTEGLNILTDPIWSERAGPFSWLGSKRVHPPGIEWDKLPKIDCVWLSHNHYDHMDIPTLMRLWERDRPRIIVPLGNDTLLKRYSIFSEAYDWGDKVKLAQDIWLHLDPMHHWSARGLFDHSRSLWAAFTMETPHGNVHFVGDSGYGKGDYFRWIKKKFGSIRFAILPIGACEPRWFMHYAHMNPEEAHLAYIDLGEPYTMASHFNVFPLADDGYGEAVKAFEEANIHFNAHKFKMLPFGQEWDVPE